MYADNARDYLKPYMATFFPQEVANLNTLPWWQYLLPIKAFGGRWGTTGFLLVNALEYRFGEPTTFYLLTAVMVIAGYILAYFTFRSLVIATLVGFALGTTTFNYHVYLVSGSVVMLPLVTLLLLFAFFQVQWIRATDKELLWGFLTILSCSLFAICYEGWLDIVPLLWIVYPVLAWYFLYNNLIYTRRCLLILAISTVISLIYVIIKYKAGLDGLHQRGSEADLILTYGFDHKLLMIEDMISSFFTFFYTTVSTYLPPELFSYSLSSWIYGPEKITTLQEGYHSEATHLTHYNHQFLWRYYAGFSLALFAVGYTKVIRRLFRLRQPYYLVLFVLMTATL
ncbi:MAG: hypothetical protein JOZ57_18525, partial [Abitibacteriaceae bacterium]|nr:hypothetical protein [Abditibacteriaceae bacterium]